MINASAFKRKSLQVMLYLEFKKCTRHLTLGLCTPPPTRTSESWK